MTPTRSGTLSMNDNGVGNRFVARGGDLVHLVSLVCLVGLQHEIIKIKQTNSMNRPGVFVHRSSLVTSYPL